MIFGGVKIETRKWICTNPCQKNVPESTKTIRQDCAPQIYLTAGKDIPMLGMYPSQDGNNDNQVKCTRKNTTAWYNAIKEGGFQWVEDWKSLNLTMP